MKIRKGDKVKVNTGKYKGTEGIVNRVLPKIERVIVEGVNVRKKAIKNKESANNENFVYIQHPIHISNVTLVNRREERNEESKKPVAKSEKKKTSKTKAK